MWRKHPHTLGPTVPLPGLYFASLGALAVASAFLPGLRGLAAAWAGIYLAAVLLATAAVKFRSAGPLILYKLPVIFLFIHLGFAWGFAAETLRPGARFR